VTGVLRQSLIVLLAGVALGLVHGVVRGFPELPVEVALCEGPVPEQPTIVWATHEEAMALHRRGAVFLDARSEEAYEQGHVAGAFHAPIETGVTSDDVLAIARAAQTVVTYCDTNGECAASTRLAGLLGAAGVADVRVLEGGMPAWLERGYPAEAGACPNDCP
jgi:rhodanese-related sulfurtransferase